MSLDFKIMAQGSHWILKQAVYFLGKPLRLIATLNSGSKHFKFVNISEWAYIAWPGTYIYSLSCIKKLNHFNHNCAFCDTLNIDIDVMMLLKITKGINHDIDFCHFTH